MRHKPRIALAALILAPGMDCNSHPALRCR